MSSTLALLGPVMLPLWLGAAPPSFDERLARGEVVLEVAHPPDSPFPVATAHVLIDASPERVWELVSDCANNRVIMPSVIEAAMTPTAQHQVLCVVTVDLPFPLDDLHSVTAAELVVEPGVRWQRRWTLVEGNYTVNEGYWRVVPYGEGRALATYHIDARPRTLLPGWLVGLIQNHKLPEMMTRVRDAARAPAADQRDG